MTQLHILVIKQVSVVAVCRQDSLQRNRCTNDDSLTTLVVSCNSFAQCNQRIFTVVSYSQRIRQRTSSSSESIVSVKHHRSFDASDSLHNFLRNRNPTTHNLEQVSTNSQHTIHRNHSNSGIEVLLHVCASLSVASLGNIVQCIVLDIECHRIAKVSESEVCEVTQGTSQQGFW